MPSTQPTANLTIQRGASLAQPYIFPQEDLVFKTIEQIHKTSPVTFTITAHGLPSDWPAWIESISGASARLLERERPQQPRMLGAPDADTLSVPGTSGYALQASGGQVVFYPPTRLDNATAATFRFWNKDDDGNDVMVLEVTEANGVTVDPAGRITLNLPGATTAAIEWDNATYELTFSMDGQDYFFEMGDVMVIGRLP